MNVSLKIVWMKDDFNLRGPWEILDRNFRGLLFFGGEGRNRTNQGSITTLNGFEDRGGHQAPITPQRRCIIIVGN